MIEDFLHLPPVSTTPVANLELGISPQIFEKIRNDPNGILRGLGETDLWKKPEVKNLVTLSLQRVFLGAWVRYPPGTRQCSGSMTFCCGSGSAEPCLRLMDPDPDSDPAIFVIELQDASKKLVLYHNFFCLLLFEGRFTLIFKDKKSKRVTE
jgi:hypothetical protein